ncbi:MAG: restriction endonuclease subunit S [Blautia sp.]|nr:restriction endonuclease subunit S [Blautia sp.]
MNKHPKIRFRQYTSDWEQRKFSDVVDIGSGMDYKHLGEGDIPVYGTGGYMLSVDVALSEDKDAIGIGRKGTIDKPYILRAPFWTVDTLFYCIPKDGYDLDFTSCLFQNVDWKKKDESTGVPSLSKVIINNVETAAPSYEEQRKIGDYFKGIDNLITLHQRKLAKYKETRTCLLQKMFCTSSSSKPDIHFSEYTAQWEKIPLSRVLTPYTDYLPTPTDGYTRLGIRSHMKGTFYEYVAPSKQLGEKRLQRVKRDNFIVNIVFAWEHAIAVTTEEDEGKLVSHRFPQFSFTEGMYPRFFHYALNDERFRHHLWLASPSGAGRNKTLRIDEMMEYELRVPGYEEQKKIADFLTSLDELIELYDYRITKLQNIKAACLQGMFV